MESIGQKRGDYNEVVHSESTKPLSGTLLKVCDLMGALDGISPVLLGANDATGVLLMPGIAMTDKSEIVEGTWKLIILK
ncbi:hypothetical protein H8356DRAFT_1423138 [Neocallimastix lanati (nom. inval.)]|nr:hypothetical protein H8356DRAFT_1423138 [Neocallimastix sp. JGI-2020a]